MKSEEIAFKDFQGAVSVKEFEAVLGLCRNQYKKVKEIVDRRAKFLEETESKFNKASESMPDNAVQEGLNRLVDGLIEKADKELIKMASEELKDISEITEFLQRFSLADEYPQLDLSFLEKYE